MIEIATQTLPTDWRDFLALTKPRVMTLVIFTGLCGLLAAPGNINPVLGFVTILCIAVGAGGSAALNMWWEADIDAGMKRTHARPLPSGRMTASSARDFGVALAAGSVVVMGLAIGLLPAAILAGSIFYYAWIYTVWLKPRTPQNIVIGGGAGAFPPVIGWVAVTGHVGLDPAGLMPILLFLIIFFWTPPHFWALALFVQTDYAKVGIPMMPVVAGERSTRTQILIYAVLLFPLALAPSLIGTAGRVYGASAIVLGLAFLALAAAVGLQRTPEPAMRPEKRLFKFSIIYLFALFAMLVADHAASLQGLQP